jgi:hypothetical protein
MKNREYDMKAIEKAKQVEGQTKGFWDKYFGGGSSSGGAG